MIKRTVTVALTLVLLAACSSDSSDTSTVAGSSSSSTTTTSSSASSSTSSAAPATLSVASNAKYGDIIVDTNGMAVYLFEPDGTSDTSKVPDNIKANWPPVTADGAPSAGKGLDASKIGGTTQVSYNGHLLYLFVGDKKAGDANGQGLGDVWYLLSPSGEKIET